MSNPAAASVGSITPQGTDPLTCNPVAAVQARWVCNVPGLKAGDWLGSAIVWPAWVAYESNARQKEHSRTVYSLDGQILYPYMGPWADQMQVTGVSGLALIIEWKRGTNIWREKFIHPGETHTIHLVGPEDCAMIEGPEEGFSVCLANIHPRKIR
ncbi:MAG: hypothetical protein IT442_13515 [Phycisphaeraceae bacterium]|nr:hypothetical protein [Phycisphaeraceae bacterium]